MKDSEPKLLIFNSPLSINVCPGTLGEGFETYSPSCLRKLFYGKTVSHILTMPSPQKNEDTLAEFLENMKRISVSGFQTKISMVMDKNVLRLTHENEQGTHILKPIPSLLKKAKEVPANEHLTMQIAKQVYGINTADNALIFFNDGEPAYITRRFDLPASKAGAKVANEKTKWGQEDFASLSEKTTLNSSEKYESSYEELGILMQKFVPAWRVEIEKYFSLVVFNFLFSNGDAHLKNFSLLESSKGDYLLSPAYDLVNTRLHVDDSDFALSKGLFADDFKSNEYKKNNHPCKKDFIEFAKRIGVIESRVEKLLSPFFENQNGVEKLVSHSFLSEPNKRGYLLMYQTKKNYLTA
ncbi:MAG: HipA domain-containing protein [Bacteroidota bacterium]|nr:HipA domain-containing protein [Bacteroidota bacterium]